MRIRKWKFQAAELNERVVIKESLGQVKEIRSFAPSLILETTRLQLPTTRARIMCITMELSRQASVLAFPNISRAPSGLLPYIKQGVDKHPVIADNLTRSPSSYLKLNPDCPLGWWNGCWIATDICYPHQENRPGEATVNIAWQNLVCWVR